MKYYQAIVFLFFLAVINGYTQDPNLTFYRLGVENGLSQSWIMCIEQDHQGFMWFGTGGGLNRYNGYNFEIYTHDPGLPLSIRNNYVSALEIDKYGKLWVGTRTGLCLYNQESNDFFYRNDWPVDIVFCMVSNNDYIYIGTYFGLFIYNIKTLEPETELNNKIRNQLNNIRVNCLAFDGDHTFWVGTDRGLFTYNSKNQLIETIENKNIFIRENIEAIEIDDQKRVWVGTLEHGLFLIDVNANNDFIFRNFRFSKDNPSGISQGNILALKIDQKNYLWISTENSGLNRLNLNNFKNKPIFEKYINEVGNINSLSNNSIHYLFRDKDNNMWVGTFGGGINLNNIDRQNFKTYRHILFNNNSLADNIVNAIYEFNEKLYIGTEGGLSVLNLNTDRITNYNYTASDINSISSNAIWSIYPENEEKIWLGTWAGGLCLLNCNTQKAKRYISNSSDTNSLQSPNIFSILKDTDGDMWFATMGGGLSVMYKKEEGKFKTYRQNKTNVNLDKSLLTDWISYLYQNSLNEIWIATIIGVDLYNKKSGEFIHFSSDLNDTVSLSGMVYYIFEDSKGTIWFATDVGLDYFVRSDSSFRFYTTSDGLPNNAIKSILEDDSGNLWLGTNNGIAMFKRGIDIPKNPEFITYNFFNGIQSNEFNRKAAFRGSNGNMYFGGINGLTMFHPDSIKINNIKPPVVLTNFFILNKSVKEPDENSPLKKHISVVDKITLNYRQSVISIEYAALNFYAPQNNKFAYKLEGFEKNWNDVGNQRLATYTNLSPGKYVFKVKASNNDGIWNETPRELVIIVKPPWWSTSFAKIIYFLLFILGIFGLHKLLQNRYKKQEKIKSEQLNRKHETELHQQQVQFFMNISHEFRTPLALIFSPIEEIIHNQQYQFPSPLKKKLNTIYKNTLRLNRLIEELMVFRKLEYNKLEFNIIKQDICAFINEIVTYFEEEAESNKIALSVHTPKRSVFVYFDSKMLEKVFFNLISNALKVTPEGGKIGVTVNDSPDISQFTNNNINDSQWISIEVSDTGPGLTSEQSEKIFELYYHINNLSKSNYTSSGIGLTLTKNLVEKHKGKIVVTSEPSKGAIFKVFLRKGKEHFSKENLIPGKNDINKDSIFLTDEPEIEINTESVDSNKKTILIVEDNTQLRNYLRDELKTQFKVLTANDGDKGIEVAMNLLPDIIVSDILMPNKNGFDLCKEIRSNLVTSHIPVILLTAKGTVEDQIQGFKTGADAYITKPFHPVLLKAKINQLLKSREDLYKAFSMKLDLIPESKTYNTLDTNFLKNLSDYIIQNISNSQLSVEIIGTQMNLSRSQLFRKVKSLTGISVNEFIRIIRLEQAKKLIITKKYQINEAGYNVGFTSPSYFSKCYRDYFGILPSEEEV